MWSTLLGVALLAAFAYLLRWFLQPIAASFADPNALSYTHTLDVPAGANASGVASSCRFPQSLLFAESAWKLPGNHVSLSAIVPAYNEEDRLRVMLDETMAYMQARCSRDASFSFEILFVDDGSRDRTAAVIQEYVVRYGPDLIRLIKLQKNQGKGGAVQQGMLHARGALLLMVDADGATRFSDLDKLEKELNKLSSTPAAGGHGIAVGSRKHLESDAVASRKWYRNVLMYGFHFLVSTLTGISHIRDTQCGFKLFTRPTAQYLFVNQHLRRWCFDVELLFLSVQANKSGSSGSSSSASSPSIGVVEVPVNWQEIPGSKINLIESSLLMGRDLVIIRMAYMLGVWKFLSHPIIQRTMLHTKHAEINQQVAQQAKANKTEGGGK